MAFPAHSTLQQSHRSNANYKNRLQTGIKHNRSSTTRRWRTLPSPAHSTLPGNRIEAMAITIRCNDLTGNSHYLGSGDKLVPPLAGEGHIKKWFPRKAFDDEDRPYLPKRILYRQKEQFNDGVSYNWIDGLKEHAAQHVNDKMMQNAAYIFPHNTPNTKEAYYYNMIFKRFFPEASARLSVPREAIIACSTAKVVEWDAAWSNNLDPSRRAALEIHLSSYEGQAAPVSPKVGMVLGEVPHVLGANATLGLAIIS